MIFFSIDHSALSRITSIKHEHKFKFWYLRENFDLLPNPVRAFKFQTTIEDVVKIVFWYIRFSKKEYNTPKPTRSKHKSFNGKHKKPNYDFGQNTNHILLSCTYSKKRRVYKRQLL